jgi:hypothetical protein
MSNSKKMIQAAAGNAGGGSLDITDVFSTYLYEGTNTVQTITNDIDLDGEGGLVWFKDRDQTADHQLLDSEQGFRYILESNNSDGRFDFGADVITPSSTGFSLSVSSRVNQSAQSFASWTFRKAPKFFDVVTYTGNGVAGRTVSHNLGTTVGSIFIKEFTQADYRWMVYHRSLGNGGLLNLASTGAASYNNSSFNNTDPTSDLFTLGSSAYVNGTGKEYVAYVFAHNDGDGEFGPDGDQDIIKCGSYTGNNSGVEIDLGFEPQWFMCKKTNGGADWQIFDTMRGMHFGTTTQSVRLSPNTSGAETSQLIIGPSSTGVSIPDASDSVNFNGGSYIYMAIRRGPLAPPTAATEVFTPFQGQSSGGFVAGFPVDMFIAGYQPGGESAYPLIAPRLTAGSFLTTSSTAAESSGNAAGNWDNMTFVGNTGNESSKIAWLWKRAPGYFDAVAYTGDGTGSSGSGRAVSHNLGVAPEMIWVKQRDVSGEDWWVYHSGLDATAPENYNLLLNKTNAKSGVTGAWANTAPTDTAFFLDQSPVNASGGDFIAYLFASLPGISKVGSYTGTGSAQTIDCGFTTGARFVLIKCTNDAENWIVFDSERGIVSGNDPYLSLNTTDAEITSSDFIDPVSSGFAVNTNFGEVNNSSNTYIFYAIA